MQLQTSSSPPLGALVLFLSPLRSLHCTTTTQPQLVFAAVVAGEGKHMPWSGIAVWGGGVNGDDTTRSAHSKRRRLLRRCASELLPCRLPLRSHPTTPPQTVASTKDKMGVEDAMGRLPAMHSAQRTTAAFSTVRTASSAATLLNG